MALLVTDAPRQHSVLSSLLALVPSLIVMAAAESILRYTGSGYSVIVITLLGVVLFTAFRSGVLLGLASATVIVFYNFYIVAQTLDLNIFSLETLQSGGVIATAFPILAFIVGKLQERYQQLLRREQLARAKAEESANQLRFMAESMPQKIFTILPNGKSEYMNPQWAEYTGSSKKNARVWSDIVHPHDFEDNSRMWKRSLETGEPFQFEHRLKRQDGTYVWHLTRARALRNKKGRISLWIGSSTDVEDIRKNRKLEADTARLTKQRAQLMELSNAKDEFISLASHQLRTPATGVKQYINMAIDGYGGKVPKKVLNLLERANDSNERQLSVINDLLKVAQVDAGKVVLYSEAVDVHKLLQAIIQDQKSSFTKRMQKVSFDNAQQSLTVQADITKLRMVIENVLDNASKYSPDNTTITVSIMAARKNVHIAIKDEGVGIAKADVDKVFQKFIRLDNPLSTIVGGNGLGLYWVKKIIELHGGKISVTSIPNKGTTFTVTLPISTQ